MRFSFSLLAPTLSALLLVAGLSAQTAAPPINVASFANPDLPNGKIAQGSMFEIFGSGIAAGGINLAADFPIPTTLAGSSVEVTVGGQTLSCPVVRTLNNDRVAAILPSGAPVGMGTLVVSYSGSASAPVPIEVVAHAFGAFTLNSAGSGPVVMTDANTFAVNTIAGSFQPGAIVDLWGTGVGAASFPDAGAPQVVDLGYDVQVTVGGRPAQVLYAGRSGCCAAVDIVRFIVPESVSGCYVPVQVTVNGAPGNSTTMSIAPNGGACSDPGGLSAETIAAAQANGSASIGNLSLSRVSISVDGVPSQTFTLNTDSASGSFVQYSLDQLLRIRGLFNVTTDGACTAFQFVGSEPVTEDPLLGQAAGRDAGTITIAGPNGTQQMNQTAIGQYSRSFSTGIPGFPDIPGLPFAPESDAKEQFGTGFLGPGQYTFTGAGGLHVGPFTASIAVPQRPQTNLSSITTVPRGGPLRVTYSAGSGADFVMVQGASIINSESETNAAGTVFFCRASASAGSFDVPSSILNLMPTSDVIEGVAAGFLGIGVAPRRSSALPESTRDSSLRSTWSKRTSRTSKSRRAGGVIS